MAKDDHEDDEPLTFEQWRQRCAEFVDDKLDIDNILDEDDPYEIFEMMQDAFDEDQSPEDFCREAFAEEFAQEEGYDVDDEDYDDEDDDLEDDEDDEDDEEDDDDDE